MYISSILACALRSSARPHDTCIDLEAIEAQLVDISVDGPLAQKASKKQHLSSHRHMISSERTSESTAPRGGPDVIAIQEFLGPLLIYQHGNPVCWMIS
jgi:hypothetical protein